MVIDMAGLCESFAEDESGGVILFKVFDTIRVPPIPSKLGSRFESVRSKGFCRVRFGRGEQGRHVVTLNGWENTLEHVSHRRQHIDVPELAEGEWWSTFVFFNMRDIDQTAKPGVYSLTFQVDENPSARLVTALRLVPSRRLTGR